MLKKEKKGITLISLVITIILLLIIATVAISLAVDSDGLFSKAGDAANKWNTSVAGEEQALKDIIEQMDNYGPVNWEKVLADATANPNKYKHEEQSSTNGDIGIGTDGKPVNMDLWYAEFVNMVLWSDGSTVDGWTLGFSNEYGGESGYNPAMIVNGEIIGKVPQYIKKAGETEFFPVIMVSFVNCVDLVKAPKFPDTVIDMSGSFIGCTSLEEIQNIPDGVIMMGYTFGECTSLKKVPDMPNSVLYINDIFSGCTSLEESPKLSNSLMYMGRAFEDCTSLKKAPIIPDTVGDMVWAFRNCTSMKEVHNFPENADNIGGAFYNCTSLENVPPEIPESATNLRNIFYNCTNIRGTIAINATPSMSFYYADCFTGAATAEDEAVKVYVTGSSEVLDGIIATKSANSKIEKLTEAE